MLDDASTSNTERNWRPLGWPNTEWSYEIGTSFERLIVQQHVDSILAPCLALPVCFVFANTPKDRIPIPGSVVHVWYPLNDASLHLSRTILKRKKSPRQEPGLTSGLHHVQHTTRQVERARHPWTARPVLAITKHAPMDRPCCV